jgi:dTDP-glucose 4,6-dehydratase
MIKKLHNKRIFVTGGTGFFGTALLNRFIENGIKSIVLTRNPGPKPITHELIEYVLGDVKTFKSVLHFDYIIHMAVGSRDDVYNSIVDGTHNILNLKSDRMLFVSSGAVYGKQNIDRVDEDFIGEISGHKTAYAEGKRNAEKLCIDSGLNISIARPFAFIGPMLQKHFAINCFIQDAIRNQPIHVTGDGSAIRSYMHTEDLIDWLLKIIVDGMIGRAYNVGSEDGRPLYEWANLVSKISGVNSVLIEGQASEPDRYVPSTLRARNELGLEIKIKPEDAILRSMPKKPDQYDCYCY